MIKKDDVIRDEEEILNISKMISIDLNAYNIIYDLKNEFKKQHQRYFTFSDVIRELNNIKTSNQLKGGNKKWKS